ncbi:hypothetical protein [Streptomyces sp. NPDC093109]|uniref:hypothetical protein n=1 Tax=Streptomyces sp. NPDC093109 TaxID=3154977 RepID=UPI0034501806
MTHLHHPLLSGLGRNPAAPEDVLVRLAAHPAGRHGIAGHPGPLPDAVVEALLAYGDGGVSVGRRRDRLSPAMRRRIAGHPDPAIRDAHADFVRSMVDVEVPIGIDDLEEAYGRPRTALVGAPSPLLRAAVARAWRDRPLAVHVELLADPDPMVRATATGHGQPAVPPEWRDRCLADPATRANVARHTPLTWDQFVQLMRSEDEEVHQAVAENPCLSSAMVARILEMDAAGEIDDPIVRVAVAQSRHTDPATRDRLYAHVEADRASGSTRADVALSWYGIEPDWLREAPLEERLTYLDCPHTAFRNVLASCHDLPDEAWRQLDNDPELTVRRTAARRPTAPPEVLERLVRAHGETFHIRPLLVDHPRFPRHTLRTLVDEPSANVRYVALQDPELPVPALEQLAADAEPFVRRGVAGHPNITSELLTRLLSDPDPEVADAAAANPALRPAEMYEILATHTG